MNAAVILALALGGGAGALCRGLATRSLKRHTPSTWPFATLIVNLAACFAAGLLLRAGIGGIARAALVVGFLGGFSTLATMNFEAVGMFRSRRYLPCLLYLVVTYASTIGAAALGFAVASLLAA